MRSCLSVILVCLFLQPFAQSPNNRQAAIIPVIDAWLDAQRDFDKLPGLSVAIVHDQDLLFKKGYGYADLERKVPMKAETLFSICSISKLFTSVAIMQLWEKGKLRLDDSLQALLPSYSFKQQYESVPVTVRSMLTHSSGITRDADSSWSPPGFNFPTPAELKTFVAQTPTLYPSSTYFQYSNLAMSLLGEIVAEKSGQPYADYVETNILQPLQLSHTHPYLPEKLWRGEMASGYSALYRDGNRKMQPFFHTNAITPAAGYSSNVIDLARFASWQLKLLSAHQADILRPSTLKEMQRIQWASPDKKVTWGLGFRVGDDEQGTLTVGHDGSCPGYVSVVLIDPKDKYGVSVMVNAQGVDVYKYANAIFALLNKDISADTAHAGIDMSDYAGRYDMYAWNGETNIFPFKGKLLMLRFPSDKPAEALAEYQYVRKDVFRKIRKDDKTLGEELLFERDQSGKIKSCRSFSMYQQKIN